MTVHIKRILIVDDDEADCFLVKHVLRKFSKDIKTFFAHDGEEALVLCETTHDIDAIILDINMPIMTGHEFLAAYSKKFPEREVPVFTMLTSTDNERDKEQALRYPVVKDFVIKPITIDKIELLNQTVGKLYGKVPN